MAGYIIPATGAKPSNRASDCSLTLPVFPVSKEAPEINKAQPDKETLHQCAVLLADEQLPDGWQTDTGSGLTRVAHHSRWQLYYREFPAKTPAESLQALVKGSDADRAWNNNQNLLWSGFGAPPTVARGELPGNREYIFTGTAKGERLSTWIKPARCNEIWANLEQRWQLLRELGIFVGRLHVTGFAHGNLQTLNILVDKGQRRFEFSLINNERNRQSKPVPGKLLLKNLMQLNMHWPQKLSRSDRLRFFRAWHSQMGDLSTLEANLLAKKSYQWAMQRLGHGR